MENLPKKLMCCSRGFVLGSLLFVFGISVSFSQSVSISSTGTLPNASAGLDINFPNLGFLIPRIALTGTASFAPLSAHTAGMLLYNTTNSGGVSPGLYCDNGSKWIAKNLPNGYSAGDFQYWNGTSWTILPVGQPGQYLMFTSANAPAWSGAGFSVVITPAVTAITATTATCGGNIVTDGGNPVTARGVCWSTSPNPTTALTTKTADGTGTGVYASSVTGLITKTSYYIRSYSVNSAGTIYGNQLIFTTP